MLSVSPSCKSSRPSRLADIRLDGTKGLASWYNFYGVSGGLGGAMFMIMLLLLLIRCTIDFAILTISWSIYH